MNFMNFFKMILFDLPQKLMYRKIFEIVLNVIYIILYRKVSVYQLYLQWHPDLQPTSYMTS